MKKFLGILFIAASLVACNDSATTDAKKDSVEKNADSLKDKVEDHSDAVKDSIEDRSDAVKDSLNRIDSMNKVNQK